MATLSIMGLYNYDNTVFDGVTFPVGIDRETAINNILMNCASFSLIYPSLPFMKFALKNWSDKYFDNFRRLQEMQTVEYTPIWNKDGTISESHNYAEQERRISNTDETGNNSGKSNDFRKQTNDGEQSTENAVSAYNETDYTNRDRQTAKTSSASGDLGHMEQNTEYQRGEKTDDNTIRNHSEKYERVEQGNIGVTSTQQLINEEISLWQKFNIYDVITASFKREFCVMIY